MTTAVRIRDTYVEKNYTKKASTGKMLLKISMITVLFCLIIGFCGSASAGYANIERLLVPRIAQRDVNNGGSGEGDCYVCSVASVQAYFVGRKGYSYGNYYRAYDDPVDYEWSNDPLWHQIYDLNGGTYMYDATLTKIPYPMTGNTYNISDALGYIYTALASGSPVTVHHAENQIMHASVVIGYEGNGASSLRASDFIVMEIKQAGYLEKYYTLETWMNRIWGHAVSLNLRWVPNPPANVSPIGSLEAVSGGLGLLHIAGWAKDANTPNLPVSIHVYIGGPAGSGAPHYTLLANKANANSGGNYGFDENLIINEYGTQQIYVYMIDTDRGHNPILGSATVNITQNHSPIGGVFSITGSVGTVTLSGYSYDEDPPNRPVLIHMYIGGPAGSSAEFFDFYADVGPEESTGYWFFDKTLPVKSVGDQPIYVYALNTDWGSNTLLAYGIRNIQEDKTPPEIRNVQISDVTAAGYTVSCDVSDNAGVVKVAFPTWTVADGQDDLPANWSETQLGEIVNGHVSFRVNTAVHGYQAGCDYVTHIYAFDKTGNSCNVSNIDYSNLFVHVPNPISNVEISEVTPEGYMVSCDLDTSWSSIDRVCFPTWTIPDGQDDLTDTWQTTATGTINHQHVSYRVKTADHGNQTGCYYTTHIYVFDNKGNVCSVNQNDYPCLNTLVPAVGGYCGDEITWILSENGTLTVSGNGELPDYEYEEPAPWQDYSEVVTRIVIENGVTGIGESAFYEFEHLTSVSMAESVTHIGTNAFQGCCALTTLQLSSGLKEIGSMAFSGCSLLEEVMLPNGLEMIDSGAFAASGLTMITIPSGTQTKTWDFFYPANDGTINLYHLELPDSVQSVGYGAFSYNSLPHDQPDFIMPADLTMIDAEAFAETQARFVWLSENTETISESAFYGCNRLQYIYIPWGCKNIAPGAFPESITILGLDGYGISCPAKTFADTYDYPYLELQDPFGGNG